MIKITGGELKGRLINTNSGLTTRPTGSKIREALFSIIGEKIIDSSFLDLFGGSGIVGIEAISRHALNVTFTELDFLAFNLIKKNIDQLNISEKVNLVKGDSIKFLDKCEKSFDFIFIDPPYNSDLYQKSFSIISKKLSVLNPKGILIVEHKSKISLPEISLMSGKVYKYGESSLSLFYST